MIGTAKLLDDIEFAKAMLENQLINTDIGFTLRNLLKMKYYPVPIKFFCRMISSRISRKRRNTKQQPIHLRCAIM